MSKFGIDCNKLDTLVNKRAYRLSEVQDKIEKVAFDIVRFRDNDDSANLWQIQDTDDGKIIVALYDESTSDDIKVKSSWEVIPSKISGEVNFFYKGEQIAKMASSKIGIPQDEVHLMKSYLPKKLSSNKKLVYLLLDQISPEAKKQLFKKYPELQ